MSAMPGRALARVPGDEAYRDWGHTGFAHGRARDPKSERLWGANLDTVMSDSWVLPGSGFSCGPGMTEAGYNRVLCIPAAQRKS